MVAFATAEYDLLDEIETAIEAITPDVDGRKPFERYKDEAEEVASLTERYIGLRRFEISAGRNTEHHGFGKAYQFPLYEYDITVQYPKGIRWTRAMHSDIHLIKYKLLNTPTSVSGVQARWIKPDKPLETMMSDDGDFQSIVLTLSVYYEITDTA